MLETTRLKLVPLDHDMLVLYKNNYAQLSKQLGILPVPIEDDESVKSEIAEAIGFWIAGTREFPHLYKWYTNWMIILKESNRAVGGVGFSGAPHHNHGNCMVGYGIDIHHYRQGIATEALSAVIRWAFSHKELISMIADTPADHIASQRVLIKNQFEQSGSEVNGIIRWKRGR